MRIIRCLDPRLEISGMTSMCSYKSESMKQMPKIVVIGGGISGLSCAHRLIELRNKTGKNFDILLLEAGARLGGMIETEKRDGFLLEKGPDAFLREKSWALDLAKRVGLENEIIETRGIERRSFIVRQGKLQALPKGFYLIGPSLLLPFLSTPIFSLSGKMRILSEAFVPRKMDDEDESIAAFVRRRFGNECLERAGQPLLAGIYAGDPESLSLLATLPRFRMLEKKYGSVIRGLRRENGEVDEIKKASGPRYGLFVSFRNGMETFTEALSKKIPNSSIRLNTGVKKISKNSAKNHWKIETTAGQMIEADAVCLTLPARQTKELIKEDSPELFSKLAELRYESMAIIYLAYRTSELGPISQGFGFVVPRTEKKAVLACTFVDQKFENRAPLGHRLFRIFVGGAFSGEFLQKDDKSLLETIQKELQQLLEIQTKPLFSEVQRHPSSMVQCGVGHLDWLAQVRALAQEKSGLYLTGAGFGGVGIPDCVREAEICAENIYKEIMSFPQSFSGNPDIKKSNSLDPR